MKSGSKINFFFLAQSFRICTVCVCVCVCVLSVSVDVLGRPNFSTPPTPQTGSLSHFYLTFIAFSRSHSLGIVFFKPPTNFVHIKILWPFEKGLLDQKDEEYLIL